MALENFKPILTVKLNKYNQFMDKETKEIVKEVVSYGGVTYDNMQKGLGYVFDSSRYNQDGSRKFIQGVIAE